MALADHFPSVVWVWRRVTTRRARRIWLFLAISTLLLSTVVRIYAAIFEHRVSSILNGLAQVHLDQTTKADLLKIVPGLHSGAPSWAKCHESECYSTEISNYPSGLWFRLLSNIRIRYLYKLGYWLGLRVWIFSVEVDLREGKVHRLLYDLSLDDGSGLHPGLVTVGVKSLRGYSSSRLSAAEDESPDYQVTDYFKWPELDMQVVFTPAASPQLIRHAFDLHLSCIWHFMGCRTTRQLLPLAWNDKQTIDSAVLARLRSSEPCPDRILPHRARDTSDILLVEVVRLRQPVTVYDYARGKLAQYRLLEVLKGKVDRPLDIIGHSPTTYEPGTNGKVYNASFDLIYPGSEVLMFSSKATDIGGPCDIVAATPSALETIRNALASPTSRVSESDRGHW